MKVMSSSSFPLPLSLQPSFLFPLRKLFLCLLQCSSLRQLLILKSLFFCIVLSIIFFLFCIFNILIQFVPHSTTMLKSPALFKKWIKKTKQNKKPSLYLFFLLRSPPTFLLLFTTLLNTICISCLTSSSSIFSTQCGLALLLHHGNEKAIVSDHTWINIHIFPLSDGEENTNVLAWQVVVDIVVTMKIPPSGLSHLFPSCRGCCLRRLHLNYSLVTALSRKELPCLQFPSSWEAASIRWLVDMKSIQGPLA